MEHPSVLSNRETYRRSLQSSLHDVLGDVSSDVPQVNRPTLAGQPQMSIAQPRMSGFSTLESSILASRHASGLSQSIGMPFPGNFNSQMGLMNHHDILLAQAAKNHFMKEAAKTALLQQTLAAQRNNKAVQDAYLQMLQSQMAASSQQTPVGGVQSAFLAKQNPSIPVRDPAAEKKQQVARTLKALGTSLRSRYDPFIDCNDLEDPEPVENNSKRSRGGVSEHFPERLHRMLVDVEKEGNTDVVSFYSHGRAFAVHDMDRFVNDIMPKYFKQSKWNSFARQLNLYGFVRMASGPDAGAYYHELFLKGRPSLCRYMRRVGVPQGQQDRRKCRPKNVVDIQEPNFYEMTPSK